MKTGLKELCVCAIGASLVWIALPARGAHAQDGEGQEDVEAPAGDGEVEGVGGGEDGPSEGGDGAESEEPSVDPERLEEARGRFRTGVQLAQAGNCVGALAELRASLEIVVRPSTLFNIASCQEQLHRYDLAVSAYQRYLESAPDDDPDRPSVVATMRALSMLLGTIHIESNVPAQVWLDDRVVGEAPGDVLVPGGLHTIELRAQGYLSERLEAEVRAQSTVEVSATLSSAEETTHVTHVTRVSRPPLPPALIYGGIALTVVVAGIGTYFGVNALLLSDVENARDPRLPPDTDSIAESALAADVLFASAGLLAAVTFGLAFLTDWGGAPDEDGASDEDSGALRVVPIVSPTSVGAVGQMLF